MPGYNETAREMIYRANHCCAAKGKECVFGDWSKYFTKKKRRNSGVIWVTKMRFKTCKNCKQREYDIDYFTDVLEDGKWVRR